MLLATWQDRFKGLKSDDPLVASAASAQCRKPRQLANSLEAERKRAALVGKPYFRFWKPPGSMVAPLKPKSCAARSYS